MGDTIAYGHMDTPQGRNTYAIEREGDDYHTLVWDTNGHTHTSGPYRTPEQAKEHIHTTLDEATREAATQPRYHENQQRDSGDENDREEREAATSEWLDSEDKSGD